MRKRLYALTLMMAVAISSLLAQQGIASSGQEASGSGGTVSSSLGQLVCQQAVGAGGSVSQGVQQTYIISFATGYEAVTGISLSAKVYPNPTTDFVVLKVDLDQIKNLSYQLIDATGQHLQASSIADVETQISMAHLPPAIYFVKVLNDTSELTVFKIVKN